MTAITTADLAQLVAMKARLDRDDPALMAGVERAVVEIVYLVQTRLLDDVEKAIGTALPEIEELARRLGRRHERDSARVWTALMAALDARDGGDGPHRQRRVERG
jgi:hypothetical protein